MKIMQMLYLPEFRPYVWTALGLSVLCPSMVKLYELRVQSIIRNHPAYQEAVNKLKNNRLVVEFLGEPIIFDQVNRFDGESLVKNDRLFLKVPLIGSKVKADMKIEAQKNETQSDWQLIEVVLQLKEKINGKRLILHQAEKETKKEGTI